MIEPNAEVGDAFAEYLQKRDGRHARLLAIGLASIGDTRRAEALRTFADHSTHTVPAGWWSTESACHISLELPSAPRPGDLWFDPLEASFFLGVPHVPDPRQPGVNYPDQPYPSWYGWIAIQPVTPWQMHGAHALNPEIPAEPAASTAIGAELFGELVGKSASDCLDWCSLCLAYDSETVLRVWGTHAAEYGLGSAGSGDYVRMDRSDIEVLDPHQPGIPQDVLRTEPLGLPFRTSIVTGIGFLTPADGALERTWH